MSDTARPTTADVLAPGGRRAASLRYQHCNWCGATAFRRLLCHACGSTDLEELHSEGEGVISRCTMRGPGRTSVVVRMAEGFSLRGMVTRYPHAVHSGVRVRLVSAPDSAQEQFRFEACSDPFLCYADIQA